jgi:thymidylate synthase
MEWPICYRDELIVGNAKCNTAICTLWMKKDLIEDLPREKFSLIGNLYSTYGINPMLRNLLSNPRIRYMIICGADLINTADTILNFVSEGVDDDYKIRGCEAYLDSAFSRESLEELRKNLQVIDLRKEKSIETLNEAISRKLSEISREEGTYMEPVFVEEKGQRTEDMRVEDAGYRIEGNTISDVWLRALDSVVKFGELKDTEYATKQKEVLDLVAVIKGEETALPAWAPIKEGDLEKYYRNFFNKEKPLGVEYTYGERLFNLKLSNLSDADGAAMDRLRRETGDMGRVQQIKLAMDKLKESPSTRRAVAVTWRHETDACSPNAPCLMTISWNIKFGRLYQTATFRSHDIYDGWLLNAFALRKLQKDMAEELGLEPGDLVIVSVSAHIYENKLEAAARLVEKNHAGKELAFEKDPRGFFVIAVKDGEIIVQHRVNDGRESKYSFRGRDAQRLYRLILNENLVSKLDHAAYLGKELARAEECLKTGARFVQNEA